MIETLLRNVKTDMQRFQTYGTAYRKETAQMAYQLLRQLVQQKEDVFAMTKERLETCAKEKYSVDEHRIEDIAKFLYVHKEQVLSEQSLADIYKEVDLMLKRNMHFE